MNKSDSVAILGGMGYLGQGLYSALSQQNVNVWVIGRQSAQDAELPGAAHYRSAEPSLELAVAGASTVFHFASVTTPAIGEKKPLLDIENIALTLSLLEACVKAKVGHLIFASSGGTIYGERSDPASEESPANPLCSYGIAKLACERYLQLYARSTSMNISIARISNLYGGKQVKKGDQGVISYLANQIAADQDVHLLGDTIRDYIYIEDVLNALQSILERPAGFQIYNISTGVGTSLVALTKLMYRLLGKKERIVMGERRPFDVHYSVLKNKKANEQLGWVSRHRLEDCLPLYLKNQGHRL